MRRNLFVHIVDALTKFDSWFMQRRDALGRLGLSIVQKFTAAICMLAFGLPVDACNDYCHLGESIALVCLERFVVVVRGCFKSTYLRQPTRDDLELEMAINKGRGFPGMFGSLDCMH